MRNCALSGRKWSDFFLCRLFLISTKQKGALFFAFFLSNFFTILFIESLTMRSTCVSPAPPPPSASQSVKRGIDGQKKKVKIGGALCPFFLATENCFPHRNRWVRATPLRVNVSSQKKWKEETRAIFLKKKKTKQNRWNALLPYLAE